MARVQFQAVVRELKLLEQLSVFCPMLIGTPPLGIDIASSDIDVACYSDDLELFDMHCFKAFGTKSRYSSTKTTAQTIATSIVRFSSYDWDIEIFCQTIPVEQQWGVRHFKIEQRILSLDPRVAPMIRSLKERGLKTEPAFATLLGLKGDSYTALLELENETDKALSMILIDVCN